MRPSILPLVFVPMLCLASLAHAQPPHQPHAGEIAAGLRRLGVAGSVLYIAAHPDDENSKLLAWLVGERGLRAGYLSLTRGDGGQNLLGTEQDELLGLIRTHELLAARAIDGAEQLFTRARDLGFTKRADEALALWGYDAVLADVVLAIRRFRPDVVVLRFDLKLPNHGHHTASAILGAEAFAAAADPERFPEQLTEVKPWQADRLLHNVSTWNLAAGADMSAYLKLDVGGYDALRGRAWTEIAAESRSQHKSQGFGVAVERGPAPEYFEAVAGTRPKHDVFEGLDLTWHAYKGGDKVALAVDAAVRDFHPREPHKTIAALWQVHAALEGLPDANPYKALKLQETEALIAACAGVFLEARTADPSATPGSALDLKLTVLNRSSTLARLVGVQLPGGQTEAVAELRDNVPLVLTPRIHLAPDAPISTPYWLRKPVAGGLDAVPEPRLVGRPLGDPPLQVGFVLELGGHRLTLHRPVVHVWVDPIRGELSQLFEIVPDATATLSRDVIMVPNGKPQPVSVVLAAGRDGVQGLVKLQMPAGWRAEPAEVPFQLAKRGDERTVRFEVKPPAGATERATFQAVTVVGGKPTSWRVRTVHYDHIPPLAVRQPSEAVLVPFALEMKATRIGYIPGPGDRVAESLAAVGCEVTLLPDDKLEGEPLDRFDAILVGIRAFNQNPRLARHRDKLLQYVERGGRLLVQYQTNSRLAALSVPIGPYPLEIGRDRVTDETAAMTPLLASDPLLQAPNKLGPDDFAHWVQERGLYFAATWDERYRPVFTMQDPQELPQKGALLVAPYGKGRFIYTGLAFFRELPAGVPGAYRLLANLLAP